jgi:hypothetical protein
VHLDNVYVFEVADIGDLDLGDWGHGLGSLADAAIGRGPSQQQAPDIPEHLADEAHESCCLGAIDDPAQDVMGPFAATCVNVVYGYRHDALRVLQGGKRAFVAVVLLTIVFLFARCLMSYLAVRFLGIEAGLTRVIEIQAALIFIVYFAPTPGSAGVAEGASLVAMQGIVTAGFAPYYNVLWRFTTGYLQAFAGLVFLARAVARDARAAIRTRSRP